MEEWSNGFLERDKFILLLFGLPVQYSNTPSLQYSIIPYCE